MTRRRVTDEQMGKIFRRYQELTRRVDEGNVAFDKAMEGLQRLIESGMDEPVEANSYTVTVDRNRTLAEMIDAGGYDWVNSYITQENFPLVRLASSTPALSRGPDLGPYRTPGNGHAEIRLELVHYGKLMMTRQIEADLDRRGLRPAILAELLTLAEKNPDLQRRFPIVALGSSWVGLLGNRSVLYLCGSSDGRRGLELEWDDSGGDWPVDCRFLAVRPGTRA